MTLPDVDPARLAEEWAADKDVLKSLADNGDRAEIVRPVDISFRGDDAALERLEDDAEELGFSVIEREETEDGLCLFLGCEQSAEEAAIKALTLKCLQIEILYGVEYDGWGCTAEDGTE
jgi:regulator of RNase E activity RraB